MKEIKTKIKPILIFLGFLLTIFFNYLTATGKLNGLTQKVISDRYNTLITPAPLAFSIWSVIYFLTLFVILLAIFSKNKLHEEIIGKIFNYFLGILILNIVWNVLFVYEKIGLSTLAIVIYLVLLMKINYITKRYNLKNLYKITFGLHGGWLIIASLVNIAAFFKKINFQYPLDKGIVAIIIMVIVILISIIISKFFKNPYFLISVSWALFNIYRNHSVGTFNNMYPNLQLVSLVASIVSILGAIYIVYSSEKNKVFK